MATFNEAVTLIAEMELTGVSSISINEVEELIAEVTLTSTITRTRFETGRLIAEAVLSSFEDVALGTKSVTYTPVGGLPITLIVPKPVEQIWFPEVEIIKAGPFAVVGVIPKEEIVSAEIRVVTSDVGDATLVLANEKTYLIGSTLRIKANVNGVLHTLFTGFLDYESNATYDPKENLTTLTLKDSLSWLSDTRRAVTFLVRGTNNPQRAGLSASDVGEEWYAKWLDQPIEPAVPGETRQSVISRTLGQCLFPFAFTMPSDGGIIGWDVEVTQETPLDVIRLVAESAGWVFFARPNGDVEFRDAEAPQYRLRLKKSEYFIDQGLSMNWGGTFINSLQVKGVNKKFAAVQFIEKEELFKEELKTVFLGPQRITSGFCTVGVNC